MPGAAGASVLNIGPALRRVRHMGNCVSPALCNPPCRLRAGRAAVRPGATASGGLQPLQQKLQQHIDREDRRIKELTEGGCWAVDRLLGMLL